WRRSDVSQASTRQRCRGSSPGRGARFATASRTTFVTARSSATRRSHRASDVRWTIPARWILATCSRRSRPARNRSDHVLYEKAVVNTPEPDRDETIDRLLRRSMRAVAPTEPTPRCVGADTLAAWIDGGLPADEAAAVEAHASVCPRCQAMVATLI